MRISHRNSAKWAIGIAAIAALLLQSVTDVHAVPPPPKERVNDFRLPPPPPPPPPPKMGAVRIFCVNPAGQALQGIKLVLFAPPSRDDEKQETLFKTSDGSGYALFDKDFRFRRHLQLTIDDAQWTTKWGNSISLPRRTKVQHTSKLTLVSKVSPSPQPPSGFLTISCQDPNGNAVPGVTVELTADGGTSDENEHTLDRTTDDAGQAVFNKAFRPQRTVRLRVKSDEWSLTNLEEYVSQNRASIAETIQLQLQRNVADFELSTSPSGGMITVGGQQIGNAEVEPITRRLTELRGTVKVEGRLETEVAVMAGDDVLSQGDPYETTDITIPLYLESLRQLKVSAPVPVGGAFDSAAYQPGDFKDGKQDICYDLKSDLKTSERRLVTSDGRIQLNIVDNRVYSLYLLNESAGAVGGIRVGDATASVMENLGEPDETEGTSLQLPAAIESDPVRNRPRCTIGKYLDNGIWFYSGPQGDPNPRILMIAVFKRSAELLGSQ